LDAKAKTKLIPIINRRKKIEMSWTEMTAFAVNYGVESNQLLENIHKIKMILYKSNNITFILFSNFVLSE
jgi:hypothetical protein